VHLADSANNEDDSEE